MKHLWAIVRMPEERERIKTPEGYRTEIKATVIDLYVRGAAKDKVLVLVERTEKNGTRIPVLEINPLGTISEVLAPRLYSTIKESLTARFTDSRFEANGGAIEAYSRLSKIVGAVELEMKNKVTRKRLLNQKRRDKAAAKA